jgi:predicted PurR-regulated permease PerM
VAWLHRRRIPRWLAVLLVLAGALGLFKGGASATLSRVALGVGKVVLDAVAAAVVAAIVSIYLLCDLPRLKRAIYQIAPRTRPARMVLLTDEILNRVGGYVLGNLLTSFIAGFGTWAWAMIFGIPVRVVARPARRAA